jgi:hypothetical protein
MFSASWKVGTIASVRSGMAAGRYSRSQGR